MIVNIRGANGAGKTTAARYFITPDCYETDLAPYKTKSGKDKAVLGTINPKFDVTVVGSYRTGCGGMDTIPSFDLSYKSIRLAGAVTQHVVCEGILASTVFGSWAEFAKEAGGHREMAPFAFAYLRVPLAECLRRIYERNGGAKIKEDLVKSKISAIEATRTKAIRAGFLVYDLPLGEGEAGPAVAAILKCEGEQYRAQR